MKSLKPFRSRPFLFSFAALLLLTSMVCRPTVNSESSPLAGMNLPDGFKIEIFANEVENARSLCRGDKGTIFVGTRSEGSVYALVDEDGDFKADRQYLIAKNRFRPNGIAFRDGSLYVAEVNKVIRWDNIEDHLDNPGEPIVVTADLPSEKHHGWKYLSFGPDGKLYVPVGAPCNVCEREDDPRFSSILRMDPDGSNQEIYAKGVRNSVGFDFHPQTGDLWFTENGRDWLGDDAPNDELNHAPRQNMHFGFPYCHAGYLIDPKLGEGKNCDDYTPPAQRLGPHVASLGMKFYTGKMFPKSYQGSIFIAEHGSWNRKTPIGYRITRVQLEGDKAVSYEVFASGWLNGKKAWGRPVDILQMPDGSLLVSDDHSNRIYRISYEK